jgi:hypothetical protein
MLDLTGATSLAVVKDMQRTGLIHPSQYKAIKGQNPRAWFFEDILKIATIVEIAEETGFSLATAVEIARGLGKKRLELALAASAIEATVASTFAKRAAHSRDNSGLPIGWHNTNVPVKRPDRFRLAIVDRTFVYLLRRESDDQPFADRLLGKLCNARSRTPHMASAHREAPPFDRSMPAQRSLLEIKLCSFAEHVLAAFGASVHVANTHQ